MDFLKVGNWLHSSLASAIDDDDTSIVLVAGGGDAVCPTDDMGARVYPFELTLYDAALASPELDTAGREIVLVTASDDADTLTVTRAQDGTTASAHPAGELAGVFVNAKHLQELQEAIADYSTLDGLTDVDTTGVADGQGIAYDDATATWLPETFLTAETAHDLLSSRHGDTLAGAVARGDVLIGNATPKWSRLAFPATAPTGKVLMASATDVEWSANPLGTAAYADTGDFAAAAAGVTNGDSHDHSGGDGAVIPLAGMADMATASLLGRATAGAGAPEVLSAADARTLLNVEDGANAYTHPNHSGDVTSVADGAQTIAAGAVSLAKMADLAANSLIGNNTGSAATPLALSAAQVKTLLGNVYIGTTAVALDRASAGLTLAGLTLTEPVLGVATATSLNAGSPVTPNSNSIHAQYIAAHKSGGYGQLKVSSWNDTPGYGSAFTMFRARGTYASPTYCNSGDTIASWYFNSLDTSGTERAGATIQVLVDGSPGANYVPMGFRFYTYAAASDYNIRLELSASGNVVCGRQAALATNATDGFLYVPTCAGTPSGTPTSYTGKCALVFDTSNNKLYVYDGGWIQVALAA